MSRPFPISYDGLRRMDLDIAGQTAVITGAARGIGLATARMLMGDGADIAIVDIDTEAARSAAETLNADSASGARAVALPTDITDEQAVAAAFEEARTALGPVSILIHCAAILDNKTFVDSEPDDWRRMIDVCLVGPMLCIHAALPGMIEQHYGRIVCIGSDAGRVGQARLSYYAGAKGGVIAQCKSIAQEVGRHGVTLNVVSPGATNTELRQAREREVEARLGPERYAELTGKVLKRYPLGRLGEPDDIAAMIAFLASARAAWVTGQVISVNGGFAMP
ncbi:MAG: SDR family NAD(P)-dependent oxidoreductase [Pseudomonadota bacterium]